MHANCWHVKDVTESGSSSTKCGKYIQAFHNHGLLTLTVWANLEHLQYYSLKESTLLGDPNSFYSKKRYSHLNFF